jgi:probable phosphoglycerate mutase
MPGKAKLQQSDTVRAWSSGKWQGLPEEEVRKLYPVLYMRWINEPHKAKIPDGENLDLVRSRVSTTLDRILAQNVENIAIVSHRVILKIIMCIALLLDDSYFRWIKIDTGEISVLEYENGLFTPPFSY